MIYIRYHLYSCLAIIFGIYLDCTKYFILGECLFKATLDQLKYIDDSRGQMSALELRTETVKQLRENPVEVSSVKYIPK